MKLIFLIVTQFFLTTTYAFTSTPNYDISLAYQPINLSKESREQRKAKYEVTHNCQFIWGEKWYDFQDMTDVNGTTPYFVSQENSANVTAYYNFCQKLPQIYSCRQEAYAENIFYQHEVDNTLCYPASTPLVGSIEATGYKYSDGHTEMALTYNNTNATDGSTYSCLTTVLLCDKNVTVPVTSTLYVNGSDSRENKCPYMTEMVWEKNCPIMNFGGLIQLWYQFIYFFGAILLFFGTIFCFFGIRVVQIILFLLGVILTVILTISILYSTCLYNNSEEWVFWLVLLTSGALGILVGYVMAKFMRVAFAALAAFGGYLLGVLLCATWLYIYGSVAVYWSVTILFALAFAVLGFFFYYWAIILSTAFLGSYFIARGISCYVGGFPPALEVVILVKFDIIQVIPPQFYAYLLGIVFLTIFGTTLQHFCFRKSFHKQLKKDIVNHPYAGFSSDLETPDEDESLLDDGEAIETVKRTGSKNISSKEMNGNGSVIDKLLGGLTEEGMALDVNYSLGPYNLADQNSDSNSIR